MTMSAAIPQLSVGRLVRMDHAQAKVAAWRERGEPVSVTDLVVASLGRALTAEPRFAVRVLSAEVVVPVESIDVALAIPVDDYVVAPAITGADRRSLPDLARERRRLVTAVESRTMSTRDVGEPCATVSNLGPSGVEAFQALVTAPQSCVLAVGAIHEVPLVVDGVVAVVPSAQLWLTADHRLADGIHLARLLALCAGELEGREPISTGARVEVVP
jgi:pyruvate dehydrogenase E2 component (dihydrolipoamide acetyltransferase)